MGNKIVKVALTFLVSSVLICRVLEVVPEGNAKVLAIIGFSAVGLLTCAFALIRTLRSI